MKKLTVVFAALIMMLGFAGTASAQHHGNHGGNDYRGGHDYRGHDYRGGYDYRGRDYRGGYEYRGGRGGIDIIIGGGRWGYPGYPGDYYPSTRIVYENVCDYRGCYTVSHVARWDNYYRGYVWYDANGNLRVN